jgi:hypothetical protein
MAKMLVTQGRTGFLPVWVRPPGHAHIHYPFDPAAPALRLHMHILLFFIIN